MKNINIKDLYNKIQIILDREKICYSHNSRRVGGMGSFNIKVGTGGYKEGKVPYFLNERCDPNYIYSENAELLLKLYSSLNDTGKRWFKGYLLGALRKESKYKEIAYLIIYVLYKIGFIREAVWSVKNLDDAKNSLSNALAMISKIIEYEYLCLSEEDYKDIEMALKDIEEYDFWLRRQIIEARVRLLERELEGVNPEINTDRDRIMEIWNKKFPDSPKVVDLIKNIEEFFRLGESSEVKLASCIDRVRMLIVEVCRRIALTFIPDKVEEKDKEHTIFQKLKDCKIISPQEYGLIRAVYNLASDCGSHKSSSSREYARLIKNIAYELVLVLLERVYQRSV